MRVCTWAANTAALHLGFCFATSHFRHACFASPSDCFISVSLLLVTQTLLDIRHVGRGHPCTPVQQKSTNVVNTAIFLDARYRCLAANSKLQRKLFSINQLPILYRVVGSHNHLVTVSSLMATFRRFTPHSWTKALHFLRAT